MIPDAHSVLAPASFPTAADAATTAATRYAVGMARTPPASDDDDDAALFRAAIGQVRQLDAPPAPPAKPRPRSTTRMADLDDADARSEFQRMLDVETLDAGDSLRYRRDEVTPRVLQRLARGLYAAQDELDLHYSTASAAEAMLRDFIREARVHGYGCVRIIHGKGRNSDSSIPVLKNLVDRVLRRRADVLAFHSAPSAQGGTGAVLVLLKPG